LDTKSSAGGRSKLYFADKVGFIEIMPSHIALHRENIASKIPVTVETEQQHGDSGESGDGVDSNSSDSGDSGSGGGGD
jgi:uncharacterized membrane protein YgcG